MCDGCVSIKNGSAAVFLMPLRPITQLTDNQWPVKKKVVVKAGVCVCVCINADLYVF